MFEKLRNFQTVTDHRVLQWFYNFKKLDGLKARWLGELAAFEYAIDHRCGKSGGHAVSMSRIPSQDATTDQAQAPSGSTEIKHPTQNNDEARDTEWRNLPLTGEGKEPVTY